MAALLSSFAGQTDRVALYVAEARSMGVHVLAPDINSSHWDFAIEDIEGKPNIRFGMGAIKNVGQAAAELIIREREQNGKFKNLNELARRVDLRAVGKRALECLIKVGAMDAFGNRAALLASLDRIASISGNHFRAAEAGQMSLFGESTGVIEDIHLPDVSNVERREMLNWERELIGLYISDHPLTPYQQTFAQIVSYFSGQLPQAQHEEKVRVAGLVTAVRPYTTKTNKPMGFVTLEDVQGNIELVLFPKTWQKAHEILKVGQIVIVEGKVDTGSTPPKVLVDEIRTEIKILEPVDVAAKIAAALPSTEKPAAQPTGQSSPAQNKPSAKPPVPPPSRQVAETPVPYRDDDWSDMPPPPDNFPDDWESEWQPSFEQATIAARPEPNVDPQPVLSEPRVRPEPVQAESKPNGQNDSPAPRESMEARAVQPVEPVPFPPTDFLPSLYIPLAQEDKDKEHPPQQITVMLRSTGDQERDKRRIKTIYGTLISFHGKDRFSFQIYENGRGHLIDFPNDTTRVCTEVLDRLKKLMGEESWRVEEITFQ
jgi:DNA polymerase-3 subunit alpha